MEHYLQVSINVMISEPEILIPNDDLNTFY